MMLTRTTALGLLLTGVAVAADVSAQTPRPTPPTAAEAKAFVDGAEAKLLKLWIGASAPTGSSPPTSPTTPRSSRPRPTSGDRRDRWSSPRRRRASTA